MEGGSERDGQKLRKGFVVKFLLWLNAPGTPEASWDCDQGVISCPMQGGRT